jgi:mRNA interferase RelE/StbE
MLTPAAKRNMERLSEEVQRRIKAELDLLVAGSPTVDIRKLEGGDDEYRLRVGSYRVLYGVDKIEKVFVVLKIADRKESYR